MKKVKRLEKSMHLYYIPVGNKIYPSLGEVSHLKKCLVDPLSHCLVLAQRLARAVQKMPAKRDRHSSVPPLGQQESLMHSKAQLRWRECCCCCCLLTTQISKSMLLGGLQLDNMSAWWLRDGSSLAVHIYTAAGHISRLHTANRATACLIFCTCGDDMHRLGKL